MTKTKHWIGVLLAATLTLSAGTAFAIAARDYGRDLVRHQTELRACAGSHRGNVVIEIDVTGRGQLAAGRVVSGEGAMRQVGECVLREARSWTFQRSTSGSRQRYEIRPVDEAVQVRRAR